MNSKIPLAPFKPRRSQSYFKQTVLSKEIKLSRRLFVSNSKRSYQQFFCLNEKTWVWQQIYFEPKTHKRLVKTWLYGIYFDRVYKRRPDSFDWQRLSLREIEALQSKIRAYKQIVLDQLYTESNWS